MVRDGAGSGERAVVRGGGIGAHARFVLDATRINLQIALEYRASFVSQVFGMLLNDIMWIVFWVLFFQRFPIIRGWGIADVMTLWAITAAGFGLALGTCGNATQLARIISQGELDYYLGLPKNVLVHLLVSRMDLSALGDVLFGFGLFAGFLHPTPDRLALFVVLAICGAGVFIAFMIVLGSLSFWIGSSEGLTQQLFGGLTILTTYPTPLFHGAIKLVMFTVLPAWFIAHLPTALLRQFDLPTLLVEFGVTVLAIGIAVAVFYRGLRRYESGNLLVLRS